MLKAKTVDISAILDGLDICDSFEEIGIFAIETIKESFDCFSGSVQEIIRRGDLPQLNRSFVSGEVAGVIRSYFHHFPEIYLSMLHVEGKSTEVFLQQERIEAALDMNFDPRPMWRCTKVQDVLTIRAMCDDSRELFFTFNRPSGHTPFCDRDIERARLIAPMISATSRRIFAEERLRLLRGKAPDTAPVENSATVHSRQGNYFLSNLDSAAMALPAFGADDESGAAICNRPRIVSLSLQGEDEHFKKLTNREIAIARLAARGLSNKEIARMETISVYTVENHLKSVYRKLSLSSRGKLTPLFCTDFVGNLSGLSH